MEGTEVTSTDSKMTEKIVIVECIEESDNASPEDISVDLLHRMLFDVTLETISKNTSTIENEEETRVTSNQYYGFMNLPHFAFTFSKTLLDAWVKQPSPCCAAS
jgi:hypothetical protein